MTRVGLALRLLLVSLVMAGCAQNVPEPAPPATPALPEVRTYLINLPMIKNGSDSTPTPFQPLESTPEFTPTAIPPTQPVSGEWRGAIAPDSPVVTPIPKAMPLVGDQDIAGDDLVNILLIGTDRRGGGTFRTDSLIIASIRPRQSVVTLISIPRDLFVYIPGWTMQRINTAYMRGNSARYPGGGPALLKETILYNLGVRIDHMVMVDFNGFRSLIDALEGVDIPLACPYTDWRLVKPNLNPENARNWRLYTIGPGLTHMDGELALWYARARLKSNDFDRGRRQQEVLRAIYSRAVQLNVVPKIPDLYREFEDTVLTDMALNDLLALAPMALKMGAPRIRSYYISSKMVSSWWTPQGAIVLLPKREMIEYMLQEAMSPPDDMEAQKLEMLVDIWNGTPNAGWDVLAVERLNYAGFKTRVSTPDRADYKHTSLIDYTPDQDPERIRVLLKILGLSVGNLQSQPEEQPEVHYRLILGADYDPCFNPAKIIR